MKNIPTKQDDVDVLPANAWNSGNDELKNVVRDSSQVLDNTSETTEDPNPTQISRAITMASQISAQYRDTGTANAYVLAPIGSWEQPDSYQDGMRVTFQAGNANTGPSTVNVSGLGVRNITLDDGTALSENQIGLDDYVQAQYKQSNDRFEIIWSPSLANPGVILQDEGTPVNGTFSTINVTGAAANVTGAGSVATLDIISPPMLIQSNGVQVGDPATTLNFNNFSVTGTGVTKDIENLAVRPAGFIDMFGGPLANIPSGWLWCDGTTYAEADHPNLFAAIGRTYGGDAGTNTFRVPDFRGQFPRAWDNRTGSGSVDDGRVFGSIQGDEIRSHTHNLYGNNGDTPNQLLAPLLRDDDAEMPAQDPNTIQPFGGAETRPTNIAVLFVIKT